MTIFRTRYADLIVGTSAEIAWCIKPEQCWSNLSLDESNFYQRLQWTPGTKAGLMMLVDFLDNRLPAFAHDRAKIDRDSTSRLSPYIHFGEVSVRTCCGLANGGYTSRRVIRIAAFDGVGTGNIPRGIAKKRSSVCGGTPESSCGGLCATIGLPRVFPLSVFPLPFHTPTVAPGACASSPLGALPGTVPCMAPGAHRLPDHRCLDASVMGYWVDAQSCTRVHCIIPG